MIKRLLVLAVMIVAVMAFAAPSFAVTRWWGSYYNPGHLEMMPVLNANGGMDFNFEVYFKKDLVDHHNQGYLTFVDGLTLFATVEYSDYSNCKDTFPNGQLTYKDCQTPAKYILMNKLSDGSVRLIPHTPAESNTDIYSRAELQPFGIYDNMTPASMEGIYLKSSFNILDDNILSILPVTPDKIVSSYRASFMMIPIDRTPRGWDICYTGNSGVYSYFDCGSTVYNDLSPLSRAITPGGVDGTPYVSKSGTPWLDANGKTVAMQDKIWTNPAYTQGSWYQPYDAGYRGSFASGPIGVYVYFDVRLDANGKKAIVITKYQNTDTQIGCVTANGAPPCSEQWQLGN